MEAAAKMKEGEACDLLERLAVCPEFGLDDERDLARWLDPADYIGRCPQQVDSFLETLQPLLGNVELPADQLPV